MIPNADGVLEAQAPGQIVIGSSADGALDGHRLL